MNFWSLIFCLKMPKKEMPSRNSGRLANHTPIKTRPRTKMPHRVNGRPINFKRSAHSRGKIEVGAFGNTLKLSKDTPCNANRMHKISLTSDDTNSIYFEVHLLRLPKSATAAFGLILHDSKYTNPERINTLPGWEEETIGLHTDDGGVYSGTSEAPIAYVPRTFKEGDVIGIGHLPDIGFYVMCNGSRIWREVTPPQGLINLLISSSTPKFANRNISKALIGLDNKTAIITLNMNAVHPVKEARQ
eukprot:g4057.t1